MSFTQKIKDYILGSCRMDAVGIAPASAFAAEDENHRPEIVLPGAKSVIVFLKRIPDGVVQAAFRAAEDKNYAAQSIYAAYGRELTPTMQLFFMQFNISEYIERNFGYTAVPVPSGPMHNVTPNNTALPAFVGSKRINYLIHSERAAYAAGLGEIGWNNMLLTPENGPRQGIGLVVTNMELDYDEPYSGPKLCDPEKCGVCAKCCPVGAIPAPGGASETHVVSGKEVTVANIKTNACAVASMGLRKEFARGLDVPDMVSSCDPTDAELEKAYHTKRVSDYGLDHYPKHFCNNCLIYCPVGGWDEKFGKTGLSKFKAEEGAK